MGHSLLLITDHLEQVVTFQSTSTTSLTADSPWDRRTTTQETWDQWAARRTSSGSIRRRRVPAWAPPGLLSTTKRYKITTCASAGWFLHCPATFWSSQGQRSRPRSRKQKCWNRFFSTWTCSMSATRLVFWPKALGCRPESLACWSAFFSGGRGRRAQLASGTSSSEEIWLVAHIHCCQERYLIEFVLTSLTIPSLFC